MSRKLRKRKAKLAFLLDGKTVSYERWKAYMAAAGYKGTRDDLLISSLASVWRDRHEDPDKAYRIMGEVLMDDVGRAIADGDHKRLRRLADAIKNHPPDDKLLLTVATLAEVSRMTCRGFGKSGPLHCYTDNLQLALEEEGIPWNEANEKRARRLARAFRMKLEARQP